MPDRREPPPRLFVGSEVGTLRRVLVHRPGPELTRRTPNANGPLVDDMLWAERARQEHDAFTDALAEAGVVVIYLQELLTQVLASSEVGADVVTRSLRKAMLPPRLREPAREWLESLTAEALGSLLISGIRWRDLPFHRALAGQALPGDFAVPPLPDHLFTHDSSTWIYDGVSIHVMANAARRRESVHLDAIYRHHPLFTSIEHQLWTDGLRFPAAMEGGDFLVIGNGAVLVGMSERTPPAAVEALAERLFAAGSTRRVIAVPLPRQRCPTHLDRMLTMVDRDAFIVAPGMEHGSPVYVLAPGRHRVSVESEGELFATLAQWLGLPRLRLLGRSHGLREPAQEQRGDSGDVLALSRGVVLSYDHNVETDARLRHEGIEVIAIEGIDLARCRGGPRRLSCPIERDSLPAHR